MFHQCKHGWNERLKNVLEVDSMFFDEHDKKHNDKQLIKYEKDVLFEGWFIWTSEALVNDLYVGKKL